MSAAAGLLQGFHAVIALRRNEPHWMLSESDAKRYGQALANALRHMPIHAAQKTIDFSVLAFMVAEMETPRIVRSIQIAKGQIRRDAPHGPAKIFTFNPPPPSGSPHGNGASPAVNPVADQGSPPLADPPPDVGSGGDGSSVQ